MLSKIKHLNIENKFYPLENHLEIRLDDSGNLYMSGTSEPGPDPLAVLEKKSLKNSHENVWLTPLCKEGEQILVNGELAHDNSPMILPDNSKIYFFKINEKNDDKPIKKIETIIDRDMHFAGKALIISGLSLLVIIFLLFGMKVKNYNQYLDNSLMEGKQGELKLAYNGLEEARNIKEEFFLLGHLLVKDKNMEDSINETALKLVRNGKYVKENFNYSVISDKEVRALLDFFWKREQAKNNLMTQYFKEENFQQLFSAIDDAKNALITFKSKIKKYPQYNSIIDEDVAYYDNLKKLAKSGWDYERAITYSSKITAISRVATNFNKIITLSPSTEFIEHKDKFVYQFQRMSEQLWPRSDREIIKKRELIQLIDKI